MEPISENRKNEKALTSPFRPSRKLEAGEWHYGFWTSTPYNFAGPGTKLRQRLKEKVRPINKIDLAAFVHDIDYVVLAAQEKIRGTPITTEAVRAIDKKFLDAVNQAAADDPTPENQRAATAMNWFFSPKNRILDPLDPGFFVRESVEAGELLKDVKETKKILTEYFRELAKEQDEILDEMEEMTEKKFIESLKTPDFSNKLKKLEVLDIMTDALTDMALKEFLIVKPEKEEFLRRVMPELFDDENKILDSIEESVLLARKIQPFSMAESPFEKAARQVKESVEKAARQLEEEAVGLSPMEKAARQMGAVGVAQPLTTTAEANARAESKIRTLTREVDQILQRTPKQKVPRILKGELGLLGRLPPPKTVEELARRQKELERIESKAIEAAKEVPPILRGELGLLGRVSLKERPGTGVAVRPVGARASELPGFTPAQFGEPLGVLSGAALTPSGAAAAAVRASRARRARTVELSSSLAPPAAVSSEVDLEKLRFESDSRRAEKAKAINAAFRKGKAFLDIIDIGKDKQQIPTFEVLQPPATDGRFKPREEDVPLLVRKSSEYKSNTIGPQTLKNGMGKGAVLPSWQNMTNRPIVSMTNSPLVNLRNFGTSGRTTGPLPVGAARINAESKKVLSNTKQVGC